MVMTTHLVQPEPDAWSSGGQPAPARPRLILFCQRAAKQILKEPLELTDNNERADLAAELLASLPDVELRNEDAWIDEVERRARAAADGAPGLTWEETRARVEQRLSRRCTG
jgi:hypothetical protein